MELGLLYEFDTPKPWPGEHPWGQRLAERKAYEESIEQVILADQKGFEAVWCVEHHFREGFSHLPCNEAVLAALSRVTQNIKLGFGVALMPHEFIHPARVAEKVATVDLLSRGRAIWGMGRSTPMEQTAFHVDRAASKDKMKAAARSVVGMWEQEYYEEHSEYLDFPKRMVTPKPYQFPHPPAWMAASSGETAAMAGENALGLLCFAIFQPLDRLKTIIDNYREAQKRARPLTSVSTNKVGVFTLVHCAETREDLDRNRIWDSIWFWYQNQAAFTLKWELAHATEEQRAAQFPLIEKRAKGAFEITEFDREDMVIVGTPEECIRKFIRYEETGIDQVLCYVAFGHLENAVVKRSIALLGDRVIPELKQRGARKAAASLEAGIKMQAAGGG